MTTGASIAKAGCKYLGQLYDHMDCQAFVEAALRDSGITKDLKGSNAWYREVMNNGWVGTPEECRKLYGKIPVGAFLFIHAFDGGEEKRGYHDGKGNASHIGIYTGMTGTEMVNLAKADGNDKAGKYNFGDGAIHSSYTKEHVCTSKFAGKSIKDGWNKIGLWNRVDYGAYINGIQDGSAGGSGKGDDSVMEQATVFAGSGSTVNMRVSPNGGLIQRIQIGEKVDVISDDGVWSKIQYNGKTGYMQSGYLVHGDVTPGEDESTSGEYVMVLRAQLEKIYDELGDMLGLRG